LAGALNDTVAEPFVEVTKVIVGAVGGPVGVTALDAAEGAPVPALFVAVTVNWYAVPLLKPVTKIGLELPVTAMPPGDEVTV
jgi:hypothetical protein